MAKSLRNIMAIAGKELRGYFASPIAWVMMGLFAILFGYFYTVYLHYFVRQGMQAQFGGGPPTQNINMDMIRPLLSNASVLILFLLPMVTMRTYSEEKRSGTIELLLTSPLTDLEIVVGKFLGAVGLYAGLLAVTLIYISILFVFGNPEWRPVATGYLGLFLLGSCFISVGLFISSTTKNQMVAGAATFVVALMFWIINWFSDSVGPTASSILKYLSITQHFEDFAKGLHRHDASGLLLELHLIRAVPHAEIRGQRAVEGLAVKRLLGLLGWLGVVLVLAAVVIRLTKPEWQPWSQGLALAGLVTTALYALSQWRDIGRSFQGRNVKYGSVAVGSVLLFLAILVAINWIGSREHKRWDFTVAKQFTMSDQTKKILSGADQAGRRARLLRSPVEPAQRIQGQVRRIPESVAPGHDRIRRRDQRPGAVEEVQHHRTPDDRLRVRRPYRADATRPTSRASPTR